MAINKLHYRRSVGSLPAWNCPRCDIGTLRENVEARQLVEPSYSERDHAEDWWEPEHITYRLSAQMQCVNSNCGEIVFVIGAGSVHYGDDEGGDPYYETLEPRAAYPAPPVFRVEDDWPEGVCLELSYAFAHILGDAGAAANRLRTSVERLLDHLNVKKTTLIAVKGATQKKRIRISAHDRIIIFKKTNPEAADLLLAIKWLGNAGSHSGLEGISREDVLIGMEIMEHVLDKRAATVKKLAKSINKKKGPVGKPKPKWKLKKT